MRCNSCGRHVPDTEKMYSKSTLSHIAYMVRNPKIEPFVCIDCKPKLEEELNRQKKLMKVMFYFFIIGTILSMCLAFYIIKNTH